MTREEITTTTTSSKRKQTKEVDEFERDAFDHVFGNNNNNDKNNNNNNNHNSNKVSNSSKSNNNQSMEDFVIEGDFIIHTVSPGDTLERIAVRYDRNVRILK